MNPSKQDLRDTIDALTSELSQAVEVAFTHGAHDWTRMNYPKTYAHLATPSIKLELAARALCRIAYPDWNTVREIMDQPSVNAAGLETKAGYFRSMAATAKAIFGDAP